MFLSDERRDVFLPLSATGMPAEAVRRLEALGVTTLEELRDTWTYGNRQLLTDYLGESPVRFTMVRPSATLTRSEAASGPGRASTCWPRGPSGRWSAMRGGWPCRARSSSGGPRPLRPSRSPADAAGDRPSPGWSR